jgi:uncharacterized protein
MSHAVRHLDLFVTEACNLACGYCFAAGRRGGDLDAGMGREALDWLMESERPRVQVTFWGGEPLLRPRLLRDLVEHARRAAESAGKELTLALPTNATLLSDDTLGWLADRGVRLYLSIDGDAETQAARPLAGGGSSHPLARRGLTRALALQRGPEPPVRMTVTPDNVHRLDRNVAGFLAAGARVIMAHPALDCPWPAAARRTFRRQQMALADRLIERLSDPLTAPRQRPTLRAWRPVLRRMLEQPDGASPQPAGLRPGCGAGRELVALAVDGTLHPCHRFVFYHRQRAGAPAMGRWGDGAARRLTPALPEPSAAELRGVVRCQDCSIGHLCSYGCPAINFITTGDPARAPEAACELMEAQVAACRRVHEALAPDPAYAAYLGVPLATTLRRMSDDLGAAAWHLYHTPDPAAVAAAAGAAPQGDEP